jgi:hypothetical protein
LGLGEAVPAGRVAGSRARSCSSRIISIVHFQGRAALMAGPRALEHLHTTDFQPARQLRKPQSASPTGPRRGKKGVITRARGHECSTRNLTLSMPIPAAASTPHDPRRACPGSHPASDMASPVRREDRNRHGASSFLPRT